MGYSALVRSSSFLKGVTTGEPGGLIALEGVSSAEQTHLMQLQKAASNCSEDSGRGHGQCTDPWPRVMQGGWQGSAALTPGHHWLQSPAGENHRPCPRHSQLLTTILCWPQENQTGKRASAKYLPAQEASGSVPQTCLRLGPFCPPTQSQHVQWVQLQRWSLQGAS